VQLRQAQTLRVFDDHQAGVGHVHADFNHRGGDQQMQLALLERSLPPASRRIHTPVQADIQLRQRELQLFPGGFRRLASSRSDSSISVQTQ
jgi:hypothetical protein